MRLTGLRIRGFRRLRDVNLDLDHPRLLVMGDNEAGKTSLMDALVAGLFGLAPEKRGRGHSPALKDAAPWHGGAAALSLRVRLDDEHELETDWDFSAERTQVIDHTTGENISTEFSRGTHGWRDVGAEVAGLPGSVFRQVACVSEGELARIVDPAEIRESLLKVAESGVDVMVDQALRRLDEAVRQASVPRVTSATRRNEVGRLLAACEQEIERAVSARAALEGEVAAINDAEARLEDLRDEVEVLHREAERRVTLSLRERLSRLRELEAYAGAEDTAPDPVDASLPSQVERLRGRLAEASRTSSALPAGPAVDPWSDVEMDEAGAELSAPITAVAPGGGPSWGGVAAAAAGVILLAVGLQGRLLPLTLAGLAAIGLGVFLLTRRPGGPSHAITVGSMTFPDRPSLMVAYDLQRMQRERRRTLDVLDGIRAELEELLDREGVAAGALESRLAAHDAMTRARADAAGAAAAAREGRRSYEALLGGETLADLEARAAPEPHPEGRASGLPVPELARRRREARDELGRVEVRLAGLRSSLERGLRQVPEVAPLVERAADLRQRAARLDEFATAAALAATTLRDESAALRRAYAPRLQEYLSREIARVTGGRYAEAVVNDGFDVLLRVPETGTLVPLAALSRGTQQQVHLLLRLGLLEIMEAGGEKLPLLLDDALALSDDGRRAELLKVLEGAERQVIYFSAGATAAGAFGPAWRRINLPAPTPAP